MPAAAGTVSRRGEVIASRLSTPPCGAVTSEGFVGQATLQARGEPVDQQSSECFHSLDCAHPSKMKVNSMVTRYSAIFPSFTLAFSSIT